MISQDLAVSLATKGFAIPGYSDVAREAKLSAMEKQAMCTFDNPCDFDVAGFITSLALVRGPPAPECHCTRRSAKCAPAILAPRSRLQLLH